jgi:hypothetical protein
MANFQQWRVCGWGRGGGELKWSAGLWLLSHLKEGVRGGGGEEVSLEVISRPCLPISPLLSALLPFFFFNLSFAYFWLAVRLFLDKKLDR